MKKNDDNYLTYTRLLQEQKSREAYRQYGHDGCINEKDVSNTQRPPPPKPLPSAYKSTTFLSMIGKKEVTEKTSSAK